GLEVQAAQRARHRFRVVVLYEGPRHAGGVVLAGVVGLEKKAARVAIDVGLDDEHFGKLARDDAHGLTPRAREAGAGTGRTCSIPSPARAAPRRAGRCSSCDMRSPP